MRIRLFVAPVVAAICIATTIPACSQVKPAADKGNGIPLVVGSGFSSYNVDWGAGSREEGGTLWATYTFRRMPRDLWGLGIDVEARDLSFAVPTRLPNMRYDTAGGGVVYHYYRFHPRHLRPYAKFLGSFGSIDFPPIGNYSHDTRAFYSFGGGADFHAWRQVWIRADYEYQMWWHLFGSSHALTPNGFTVGPEFDFGERREH